MLKIATLALGAALLAQLGSCSTTSSTLPAVVDVQNITNAFCAFLPTATTIEAIEMGRIIDRGIRESGFVDFEKLCYQLFENELGKKYWEFVTERFLLQGFVDPASPAAPHMGVYYEGFKEGFRMSLRAIKSHKNRIAAESIKE